MKPVKLGTILGLALCALLPVAGQGKAAPRAAKARVCVMRLAAGAGPAKAAADAASDTLLLSLRSLGLYEVVEAEPPAAQPADSALVAYALEKSLDYVVFGRVEPSDASFSCSISVFDRSKGRTSISKAAGPVSPLELFDALDELTQAVLEAMTGSHLGFGRLELANSGEAGAYRVFVDGVDAGRNLKEIPRALSGRKVVRVVQDRMLGEYEVTRREVELPEGGEALVEFAIPYQTDAEKLALAEAKSKVEDALWAGGASKARPGYDDKAVEASIQDYAKLLADVSYSPKLAAERAAIEAFEARRAVAKSRAEIEAGAWSPNASAAEALLPLYAKADSLAGGRDIKAACEENALILACLFELEAGERAKAGDWAGAQDAYRSVLGFSRLLPPELFSHCVDATQLLGRAMDKDPAAAESAAAAAKAFAPLAKAAERFAELEKAYAEGEGLLVLPTDFQRPLRVDGKLRDELPLLLAPVEAAIQAEGAAKDEAVAVGPATRWRLVLVRDGYAKITAPAVKPSRDKGAISLKPSAGLPSAGLYLMLGSNLGVLSALNSVGGDFRFYPLRTLPWLGLDLSLGYSNFYNSLISVDFSAVTLSTLVTVELGASKYIGLRAGAGPYFWYAFTDDTSGDYVLTSPFLVGAQATLGVELHNRFGRLTLESVGSYLLGYFAFCPRATLSINLR